MAYKKSIRGDHNEASEEFSHNRITIVAGGAGLLLVGFFIVCCIAAIAWMMTHQGGLFSLLIILTFIGLFLGAAIVGGCFVAVHVSDAIGRVQSNKILAQTIIAGEVVAFHRSDDQWDHLSAQHIAASIPALPMKAESVDHTDKILELHDKGLSYRNIEKMLKDSGVTYYQIQRVINQYRLSSEQQ